MERFLGQFFRTYLRLTYILVVTFLPLTNLVEVDELRIPITGAAPPMDPEKVFWGQIWRAFWRSILGAILVVILGIYN